MAKQATARLVLQTTADAFRAGMQKAGGALQGFGSQYRNLTGLLTRTPLGPLLSVAGIGYALHRGITEAVSFEDAMAKVATITDWTDTQLAQVGREFRSLAADTVFSSRQVAEAGFVLVSALGDDRKAMSETLRAANELALGGFAPLDTVMRALITAQTTMGDEFRTVSERANFLGAVMKRGNVDLEQVADTFGIVAAQARASGWSMKEAGALFGFATRALPSAEMAATATAAALAVIREESGKAGQALRKMPSLQEAKQRGLIAYIEELARITQGMSAQQQADILGGLGFERRSVRGLIPALEAARKRTRAGMSELAEMYRDIEGGQFLERAAGIRRKSPGFELAQSMNQMREALLPAFLQLVPAVVTIAKWAAAQAQPGGRVSTYWFGEPGEYERRFMADPSMLPWYRRPEEYLRRGAQYIPWGVLPPPAMMRQLTRRLGSRM